MCLQKLRYAPGVSCASFVIGSLLGYSDFYGYTLSLLAAAPRSIYTLSLGYSGCTALCKALL